MTTRTRRSRGMPRRSEAGPARRRSFNPALLVGGALLLVLLVAAVVAVALSGGGTGLREPATQPVQITGSLPAYTGGAEDPAVGQTIPTLSGTGLDGEPMTISPEDGPMAIVVLAHWCPHCQAEVPVLTEYLEAQGMPEGVDIVAVSTSIQAARPNCPPSAWLEREGWPVPTLVDDASSSALSALGLNNFPAFVFVDASRGRSCSA